MFNTGSLYLLFLVFFSFSLSGQQIRKIPLHASDLLYDQATDRLLVAGTPSDSAYGKNSLYTLNVKTEAYSILLDLPYSIWKLELSKDRQLLYLATDSKDSAIIALHYPSLAYAYSFSVDTSPSTYFGVGAMAISPLDPYRVAVLRNVRTNRTQWELVIFQNGLPLTETAGYFDAGDHLVFSANGQQVYSKNEFSGGHELRKFDVYPNGVRFDRQYVFRTGNAYLQQAEEKLFDNRGAVIDITQPAPELIGVFGSRWHNYRQTNFDADYLLFDTIERKIHYYQFLNPDECIWHTADMDTYTLLEQKKFQAPNESVQSFASLQQGGDFAYGNRKHLYIVQDCQSSAPMPELPAEMTGDYTLCNSSLRVVYPPTGYAHFYNDDGEAIDSFVLNTSNPTSLRIADDKGCLSPPAHFGNIEFFSRLSPPRIVLHDGSSVRCRGGKALLHVYGLEDDEFVLWSTGDTSLGELVTTHTGPISARIGHLNGCYSLSSDTVDIKLIDVPLDSSLQVESLHGKFICHGTASFRASDGFENYHWRSEGDIISYKQESSFSYFDIREGLSVSAQMANGCWVGPLKVDFQRALIPAPAKPRIQRLDLQLASNIVGEAYEWYWNGELIPRSSIQVWEATEPGLYQVRYSNGVCWSALSNGERIP